MKLSSPQFEDGEHMPEKIRYTNENVNPVLEFEDVPEEAETLVLIMDDPDAKEPAGKVWDHWTVWNIPSDTDKIGEGETLGEEGMTDFQKTGYGGPNPPDRTHTYRFRLYAVDTQLDIPGKSDKEDVLEAIDGYVIEKARLEGKFSP